MPTNWLLDFWVLKHDLYVVYCVKSEKIHIFVDVVSLFLEQNFRFLQVVYISTGLILQMHTHVCHRGNF